MVLLRLSRENLRWKSIRAPCSYLWWSHSHNIHVSKPQAFSISIRSHLVFIAKTIIRRKRIIWHANNAADGAGTLNHRPCGSHHLSTALHHAHNSPLILPHSDTRSFFRGHEIMHELHGYTRGGSAFSPSRFGKTKDPGVTVYEAIMWQGEFPPDQRRFLL